jgi:hypothetical protein
LVSLFWGVSLGCFFGIISQLDGPKACYLAGQLIGQLALWPVS